MKIELERRYRFSASHRYFRPDWSDDENRRRFGKCALSPGHGHNYRLTVRVAGVPDATTGFVVDLVELDRLIAETVLERVDHRHLNDALPEFGPGGEIPTCEELVRWIYRELADRIPSPARLTQILLAEDDDLAALWSASTAASP